MKRRVGLGTILSMVLTLAFTPTSYSNDPIPVPTGEITNVKVSSTAINAGQSVTITFDVSLSSSTTTGLVYTVGIGAVGDENGDPWTDEVWTTQPTLISGDQNRGSWSAQVTVAGTAYSGEYIAWVSSNSKLINTRGTATRIQINGTTKPVFIPMQGSISNVAVDKSSIKAGEKVVVTFDLELIAIPTNFQAIRSWIGASTDENGDSWTFEQWQSAPSTRISGTELKGRWSTEITIPQTAFSGSYVASIIVPNKLISVAGGSANLQIVGVDKPVVVPLSGSVFNVTSNSATFEAGKTYDFEFEVSLNQTPTNPIMFTGYVATADQNGGPSIPWEDKWNKGQLVSGDSAKGKWKVSITFPEQMYTGNYVFRVGPPSKTISVPSSGFNFRVSGLTPIPQFVPFYLFSNQNLSPSKILPGTSVRANFALKTNDARVSTPECIMDGASQGWIKATLKSGTAMDGNWECLLPMDKSTPPGKYDFHMAVVGYANNEKNEERVILPVTVVANEEDLYGPFVDSVYIDSISPLSTITIDFDRISTVTDFKAGKLIARLYISPGKGSALASITGPGILGTSTASPFSKVLILNRSFTTGTNIYLFSDGLFGRSTISLTLNGKTFSKQIDFYSAVTGVPLPAATPTTAPSKLPTPSPKPTAKESPIANPSPVVPAATPSPSFSGSASPTPSPTPVPSSQAPSSKAPSSQVIASPTSTASRTIIPKPTVSSRSTKIVVPKKVTITCVKGKLTKKVTAIKPVCPTGYKKK
jgi:hypothetical protein